MNKFFPLFSVKKLLECRSVTTKSTKITADGKEVPKRKHFENRITLIGTDNSVSITDLKNAENLSVRRELKLVKIQDIDSKTRRPVYKLMTNSEYHSEELERRKEKQSFRNNAIKGQKLLTLSSRIGEHDLMTGVKKMIKLLEKHYEVKVIVAGEGQEATQNSERIYTVIEKNIKSIGKMVQKRNKGNSLRFQLLPLNESSAEASGKTDSSQNGGDKGPL